MANGVNIGMDAHYAELSAECMDEDEDDSYKMTGSPEKMVKLNDENSEVAIKTNISKLSNDFTISQLHEKVLANKNRALQNITEKVLSRQNSKPDSVACAGHLKNHNNNNIYKQNSHHNGMGGFEGGVVR